jgi:hypothetical protein
MASNDTPLDSRDVLSFNLAFLPSAARNGNFSALRAKAEIVPIVLTQDGPQKPKPSVGPVDIGQKGYLASTPISTGSQGMTATAGLKKMGGRGLGIGFTITG